MKNFKRLLQVSILTLPMLSIGYSVETDEPKSESETPKVEEKPVIQKTTYGHDESIILPQLGDLVLHAKLDTGAKTASLSAQDLKIFTKKKEKWVRFQLENGKKYYEFPIKRMSRIKNRSGEIDSTNENSSTYSERPVIELDVCLGSQRKKLEVNLTDRSRFKFQFLIGKIGLMKLKAIVDPAESKLSTPTCPTAK